MLAAAGDASGEELGSLEQAYGREAVSDALARLRAYGLVVERDQERASLACKWREWGPGAWLLHRLSSDVDYAVTLEDQLELAGELQKQPPAPWIYKRDCGHDQGIDLPLPRRSIGEGLTDALLERRTCRAFTDAPVSVVELAGLLFYTGGWLFREDVPVVGPVLTKCAPPPGARHTIEICPGDRLSRQPALEQWRRSKSAAGRR